MTKVLTGGASPPAHKPKKKPKPKPGAKPGKGKGGQGSPSPSHKTKAKGPHKALIPKPQPPRAGAAELRQQALAVGGLRQHTGIDVENTNPAVAVPAGAFEENRRSVAIAIKGGLQKPESAALPGAIKEDPAKVSNNLDRQAVLWDFFGEVQAIQSGARTGMQMVDKTRALARGLILAAAERRLGTLSGEEYDRLESDLKEIRTLHSRTLADHLAEKALSGDITQKGSGALGEIAKTRQLLSTLDLLDSGKNVSWDALVKAAATLDEITAAQQGPAADQAAADQAVVTGTPATQAADQRGAVR